MNIIKVLKFILALIRTAPILFWMTVILPLVGAYRARRDGDKMKTHKYWSKGVSEFLGIDYRRLDNSEPTDEEVLFLCNHRTQADFFISDVVTGCKANILARREVAFVFPFAWLTNPGSVWFFNRNQINIQKFNLWLDERFAASPMKSLIVYPEGHRMYKATEVTSVKTGMIKYSYMRKKKVQIVMTFGNEDVFNEREMRLSFGQKVYSSFSEVIDPKDYLTQEEYVNHVSQRFKEFFAKAYQTYHEKLEEETKSTERTK